MHLLLLRFLINSTAEPSIDLKEKEGPQISDGDAFVDKIQKGIVRYCQ
jgi:hypothetical protein